MPTINRKQFYKDLMIILMIIALPLLFYTFKLAPESKIWETEYFIINSNYFENVHIMLWILFIKFLLLGFLIVWFFTCRHWWRYAILVPIIIELNKVIVTLNEENRFLDEYEYIYTLPYTLPIIISLIFLSNKFGYYNKSLNLNQKLTQEIDGVFSELNLAKKENLLNAQNDYKALLETKNKISKEEYLNNLIAIRRRLIT